MKIPSYQKQMAYQRGYARDVKIATPMQEAFRSKKWSTLAAIGGVMEGAGRLYKAWEQKKEEERRKRQQALEEARKEQERKKGGKQEGESAYTPTTSPTTVYKGFTSPARQALLNFSRTRLFGQAETNGGEEMDLQNATAKLDSYFVQQARTQAAGITVKNPDEHLLVQDYAVLRQEVQHIQEQQTAQEQQEQFLQSAGNFIQVAGLIRQPAALQQYIEANLSAAQHEGYPAGQSVQKWQLQKQNLYTSAIRHNIEVALQSGEVEQAQQVYRHFQNSLPAREQELLQARVSARAADVAVGKIWQRAYAQCVSEQREIQTDKLEQWAQQTARETGLAADEIQTSLHARLRQEISVQYQQEAQLCRHLIEAAQQPAQSLWTNGKYYSTAAQFKQSEQFLRAMQQEPFRQSNPAVFNGLYEQISASNSTRDNILKAYEAQNLSATDALRLTEHFCSVQAGKQTAQELLLRGALRQFCQQMQLSPVAAEYAQYVVFSAGYDTQSHIQAAQDLKQLLTLQEKKK